MMNHDTLLVQLNIPLRDYLYHYHGHQRQVVATTENGHTLCFPTTALQEFVSPEGIQGLFSVELDQRFKLKRLTRHEPA